MTSNNINQLITIILYLLLALAFFTQYASLIRKENAPHRVILEIFIFGILAIASLYISQCSNLGDILTTSTRVFGYVFSGYFILFYLWFLFHPLITKIGIGTFSKEFFFSGSFLLSSFIIFTISIITIVSLIIKLNF